MCRELRVNGYRVVVFFSQEDGGYIADAADLVSCSAFGKTEFESLQEIEIAMGAWLEVARGRTGGPQHPRHTTHDAERQ